MTDFFCTGSCYYPEGTTPDKCFIFANGNCPYQSRIENWQKLVEDERKDLDD